MSDDTAVHLRGITKRFPGVVANDGVDVRVERGSVHALLGENGAGKTTLMNVLYGLYEPDEGSVIVDGDERDFDSPRDAIDAGVGMIHQHFMLVESMTVAENVALGEEPRRRGGLAVDDAGARRAVADLGDQYGFDVDPGARIADVSVGVRQRVEILKALYRGAEILILDEPTAVLTPQEVEDLYAVMEELTQQGKTIIFITHKLGEAMHAADDITVLRDGRNVGTVPADETTREALAERMVGREVVMSIEKEPGSFGDPVLEVGGVSATDDRGVETLSDVTFDVRAGEIFGIAGVDGNGQAELVDAVTGLAQPASGVVTVEGEDVTDRTRRERTDRGMAFIPEDRQERGLVMEFDLVENAVLGSQHSESFAAGGRIDWKRVREHAETIVERYDVRPANVDANAAALSGGNQQKFVVGREMARDPTLLVASHPTRGVDVGSTEFIRERLLDLRSAGAGVLLISSKLDEVRQLSDRLAVMYDGTLMAIVDPSAVTEEELGLLMAGEYPEGFEPAAGDRVPVEEDPGGDGSSGAATEDADSKGGDAEGTDREDDAEGQA